MGVILPNPITDKDKLDNEAEFVDLLPAGWYDFEVESANQSTSSSGYTYLQVILRILSGELEGKNKIWFFGIYSGTEKGIAFNRALLGRLARACGIDYLDDTGKIEGKRFKAQITEDEFNNKPQNNMRSFAPCTIPKVQKKSTQDYKPAQISEDDEIPF